MQQIKILLIEWILEVLRAISIFFLNKKARIESDSYAEQNESIDMRTAPPSVKYGIIHDESVLKMRWDICSGCEFLTEGNRCTRCGCMMKIAHKMKWKACPEGKWGKYKEINGTIATN